MDEMDGRVAGWLRDYYDWVSLGALAAHQLFRAELPGAHHRRAAAERQSGRLGRSVWRRGESDRVWSAGSGHGAISSDHVVPRNVHGLRLGFGGSRGSRRGIWQLHPAAILKTDAR